MFVWSKLSSPQWEDAWQERFYADGQTNAVISVLPGGRSIRVEVYCDEREHAEEIQRLFGGSVRELQRENWAAMKPPGRGPIKVRDRLVIVEAEGEGEIAAAARAHPGREVVAIPAQMAFGTGDHATTATCLRMLADIAKRHRARAREGEAGAGGWSMLDVGCGSGILAIAARRLGAARVVAFDYDEHAVTIARGNALRNGVGGEVEIDERDLLAWRPRRGERYDCVCANVFADVLVAGAATLARVVRGGGDLVVSGILRKHADECAAALEEAGLRVAELRRVGKWTTIHLRPR